MYTRTTSHWLLRAITVVFIVSLFGCTQTQQTRQTQTGSSLRFRDVQPIEVRQVVMHSEAFQKWIEERVVATIRTRENAWRVMILCRSPKLDLRRGVQQYMQLLTQATERMVPFDREMDDLDSSSHRAIVRRLQWDLLLASYSASELDELTAFLRSPAGIRAQRVSEARLAIAMVGARMFDLITGIEWEWPAASLRHYMQERGMLEPFNAAVNSVNSGAADAIATVSGRIDEDVPEKISQKIKLLSIDPMQVSGEGVGWQRIQEAFVAGLPAEDREAVANPIMLNFLNVQARLIQVPVWLLASDAEAGKPLTMHLQEACDRTIGKICSTEMLERTMAVRETMLHPDLYNRDFQAFRSQLQSLPESGCGS
jgi:hypothetical protein